MMKKTPDPVLVVLSGLLAVSLTAFLLGFIPYPYGLLVLGVLIAFRILYLKGRDT